MADIPVGGDISPANTMVVHAALVSLVKAALFYPVIYYALDTVVCAPYGVLDLMRLECHCPPSRTGNRCESCIVSDLGRGQCLRNTVVCNDKWTGSMCSFCPACIENTTDCDKCDGDCNRDMGYYGNAASNKCRLCNASQHCSAHGYCDPENGLCECNDGWATAFSAWEECGVQCPRSGDEEKPCGGSAHGTCTTGGLCKCNAPWCGEACATDMSFENAIGTAKDAYCNEAGYASTNCNCTCFFKTGLGRDVLGDEVAEDIAQGRYCQHMCPKGIDGDICGKQGTPNPWKVGQSCTCRCLSSSTVPGPTGHCDEMCENGAQYNSEGKCVCLIETQDPENSCAICKTDQGWYNAPLCQSYCDSYTCNPNGGTTGGRCAKPDAGENVKCHCPNPAGHDPFIERVATSDQLLSGLGVATHYVPFDITLPNPSAERRLIRYITITTDNVAGFTLNGAGDKNLSHTATTLDIQVGQGIQTLHFEINKDNMHRLHTPVRVLWEPDGGSTTGTRMEGTGLTSTPNVGAFMLCAAMASCAGYTNTTLYSCLGLCPDGDYISSDYSDVYIIARDVHLNTGYEHNLMLHQVVDKGCHKCKNDWYPDATVEDNFARQCITFCTDQHTCSGYGECNEFGECTCINANLQSISNNQTCAICKDTYYPAPFSELYFNATEPCLNKCVADAFDDGGGEHWYCSGHGQCVGNGTCHSDCIEFATGEPSGWTGAHCEIPCVQVENETDVCSGHGTCVDSACACTEGYFGKLCDVTCNQPDEYFVSIQQDCDAGQCHEPCEGLADACEENIMCGSGGEFMCTRIKCNGRKCATDYQYTHRGKTFYYEPCYAALDNETLRECTGITAEEYNRTGLNGKRIRSEHGIFCDTGARQNSHQGFCKKARCDCSEGDVATQVTTDPPDDDTIIDVETLTVAVNLGGTGCYVAGCRPADFPEGGDFSSMCGQYVPPVVSDPVSLYDELNNEDGDIRVILNRELAHVQQHCSHGTCMPRRGQPGHSLDYPAPAGAQAVRGYCLCKNTPLTVPDCQKDDNPHWAQQCCDSGAGGNNIFFGRSCTDECKCDRKLFWKGSCAGDDTSALSLGCNCRMGYSDPEVAGNPKPGELKELFCGSTCRTQCAGVIDGSGKQVTLNARYAGLNCPGSGASTAVHNASCYVGHMPCHGHGQCISSDGTCIYAIGNVLAAKDPGSCQCWGAGVEMESNAAATLPQVVALYGGEKSCELECPFASELSEYFSLHYDVLMSANIRLTSQHRAIKQRYFDMYSEKVCSGHGYCTASSDTAQCYSSTAPDCKNTTHLQCTCTGDYGGNDCDQTCDLNKIAWGGNLPWQFGSKSGNGSLGVHLATYYGLSKCGTNAMCTDERTCGPIDDGQYAMITYDQAKTMVATLTESNMTSLKNNRFFEQWSLMFVGEFSGCKPGYYSSEVRELDAQNTIYAFDLPALVRWQLKRTCDAEYRQKQWSDEGVSWCCNYDDKKGTEWRDDTAANFNGFTHGGCPDGYCSNFAVGRSCRTCISDAYETYGEGDDSTCPSDYSGLGYCAKCTGTQDEHLVSAFKSLHAAGSARYVVDGKDACEHCISYGRELSGEQQYALATTESRTCNSRRHIQRGTCNGYSNTYSGIANRPADVAMPSTGSLLCEGDTPHFTLGMCTCTEDWEGPTCAAPKTQAACGNDGTLVTTGIVSPYSNITYNKCVCKYMTGHYCSGNAVDTIYKFATAELTLAESIQLLPPNDRPALVVCNDPSEGTVAVNGRCESCSDPSLDPFSMCIEYKATGVDGIVDGHVSRVRDRSNC